MLETTKTEYNWRRIARQRWQQAETVTGSGPFAVVSRCGIFPVVRLFETRGPEFVAAGANCGPNCKGTAAHSWVRLEYIYRPRPKFPGWKED